MRVNRLCCRMEITMSFILKSGFLGCLEEVAGAQEGEREDGGETDVEEEEEED